MSRDAGVARELVLTSPAPVGELAAWLRDVQARTSSVDPGDRTFLVVTPLGWGERERLRQRLAAGGVQVVGRAAIRAWPRVASAIRLTGAPAARLRRAARFEAAWHSLFPATPAEAWALAPGAHTRAVAMKAALRRELPGLRVDLGDGWPTANVLHAFHLADLPDARGEARRLMAALALVAERMESPREHDATANEPAPRRGLERRTSL